MGHLVRGIVDEDVDAAKTLDGLVDEGLALGLLRDVPGQQQALAPGLFDPACGFLRVFVFIEVGNRDVRAFTGEGDGDGATDTTVGTGDQCDLALQAPRAFIALFASIGVRVHLLLAAGDRLGLFPEGRFGIVGHRKSPFSRWKSQRVDPALLR